MGAIKMIVSQLSSTLNSVTIVLKCVLCHLVYSITQVSGSNPEKGLSLKWKIKRGQSN